jgi:hypothetical protein
MPHKYNRGRSIARSLQIRFLELGCIALIWILAAGCKKSQNERAAPEATPAPARASASRMVRPRIVSVSPETLEVRSGHASPTRYSVNYTIDSPDRVTQASIVIYSPGIGAIQRLEVPVQASGAVEFNLDAAGEDFGPTVRFRLHCPAGETGWYAFGSAPASFDPDAASKVKITRVTPGYASGSSEPNSGILVTIWAGDMVTPECSIETEVDGRTVALQNAQALYRSMQGLLMESDIGNRAIAARYLEVNLILKGPNGGVEDIKQVRFSE